MSVLNTSAQALKGLAARDMGRKQREIFDVVLDSQRSGTQDMSLNEIRDIYESRQGRRIELGFVSARVSELVAAKRLVRLDDIRACSVTGSAVRPVCVPSEQAGLFA
ncbi:hypothetical protein SAMN05216344_106110 [Polaromonas sp. OV174]|uniref:hypothetical protein n=1 Tax=Polaromonas sp. OV174 TaxID=1855300 RepID=UPI0008ECE2F3|nr:hypothetical protein [Polaromonas sp. OV174]SFB96358.1 hypothetical protein SAMN05216344_106110 [Polaromonas sp. OV174]